MPEPTERDLEAAGRILTILAARTSVYYGTEREAVAAVVATTREEGRRAGIAEAGNVAAHVTRTTWNEGARLVRDAIARLLEPAGEGSTE